MRKILLAAVMFVAVISAPGLLADRANALTLPSQNSVRDAADSTNLTPENVRWVCRWGYYGRRCWWEPGWRRHWRYRYY